MADLHASIDAVRPFIEDILQQARQCTGSIVSLRDKCLNLLTQAGLVYEMLCAPEHVLCHDKNRFGEGLVPASIVELFVSIIAVGFSFEEANCVCLEIPNEGPRRKQLEVFNSQLAQRSEEILAPVVPDAAKLATVAGSHLSAGLRAVHFQMRWPASVGNGKKSTAALMHDGKLNRNKIAETDANFGEAVGGMKYKVIRAQVEVAFPDLADLFQEVGNIGGHLHKGESYIAMMLKIHSRGVSAPRKHGHSIDWDLVQRLVLRSQPPNPGDVQAMCRYVSMWAGSEADPMLLRELHHYASSLAVVRAVRGPTFCALVDLDVGKGKGGRLRTSCLKAFTSAAEQFCNSEGECVKFISATDIGTMSTGKANFKVAMKAEEIMQRARKLLDDAEARYMPQADRLLHQLDVDLILHIFKKLPKERAAKSTDEIAARFYSKLAAAMGELAERLDENPWAHALPKTAAPNASSSKPGGANRDLPANFAKLDSDGEVADFSEMLKNAGIVPDVLIQKNDEEQKYQVVATHPMEVHVVNPAPQRGKKKKVAIAASDVLQDYKVVKEEAVQVGEKELSQRIPACHQDVQFDAVLGCIKAAMVNLDWEMRPKLKLLKATVEPYQQRGVFAEKSIEKGTILLAPCSMHIAKLVPGRAYQDSAVDLGIVKSPWGSFSWRFVVMSPKASEKEMVSLFWFVKDAKHHELANITLTVKAVDRYGIQVQVPMMKAKKSIEAGTELKICREKIDV